MQIKSGIINTVDNYTFEIWPVVGSATQTRATLKNNQTNEIEARLETHHPVVLANLSEMWIRSTI